MVLDEEFSGLEIAIIGLSAQFPESEDYRQYWQNLKNGNELIATFSDKELLESGASEDELKDELFIRSYGAVKNKNYFDHNFFNYTPDEATLMNPQIRLFHEHCWKALEDSGYSSLIETKKIGLFAGAAESDNWKIHVYNNSRNYSVDPFYLNTISNQAFLSTTVSYKLNLRGPAIYIDTACSTSLVAVHLACRSLLTRDCVIALAGGVSLSTAKKKGYKYEEGMIVSKDGHCRAFDSKSTGTALGEGAGVVVLKRLTEAIKDGDNIYCVIKATSVNNDGNRKVGFTAPSVTGQSECIKMALKLADVDPSTISYIETHGTGTKLGDAIEIKALNEAFKTGRTAKYCAIGSVKTNIGHTNTAAGIAGLIKTALCLRNKQIPPSLNFNEPNSEIDFDEGPFYVNTALKAWESMDNSKLRAGISSFGVGGTNAHAILEEAPKREINPGRVFKLLSLSAKTKSSLNRYIDKLSSFLDEESEINVDDMSFTFNIGRKHFKYRKSVVFKNKEELATLLKIKKLKNNIFESKEDLHAVIYMFSGAGSQYINMGKDLYEQEPIFKEEMDKGFSILKDITGYDYKSIIFPLSPDDLRINDMLHTQPIIFLFGYSLARLLMFWGVEPKCMIGHSIGEYIAACISGVFSYDDALKLVVKRGQLMNQMPAGNMISVAIKEEEANRFINDKISVAAINSPEQIVYSGDVPVIDGLIKELELLDISYIKLFTSHAGHSNSIDFILKDYEKELAKISFNLPKIPFISNLTGQYIKDAEAVSVNYWLKHMRNTVKFSHGIKTLLAENENNVFIEFGGGHSLSTLLTQQKMGKGTPISYNLIRHPKEEKNDFKHLITCLGELWGIGININWANYYKNEKRGRVSLPTYAFEPNQFVAEVDPFKTISSDLDSNKNIERQLKNWIYFPIWKHSSPVFNRKNFEGKKGYLFFSLNDAFCDSLKVELMKNENLLIDITIGYTYKKVSKYEYIINPLCPDHIKQVFTDAQEHLISITDIIYALGMSCNSSRVELLEDNKDLHLVFFDLVQIIKELSLKHSLDEKKITILTQSLYKVLGDEKISVAQSLILGLANVIPQEYSVLCCNIDIVPGENSQDFFRALTFDINNTDNSERIIAYRKGVRWIPDYQKNIHSTVNQETPLKVGGVYLITGGLGNVGFILSKYLIQKYKAKVIILGRSRIGHNFGELEENKSNGFERLRELTQMSTDVSYYSVDISKIDEVKIAIASVEKIFGKIDGVVHTAGNISKNDFELIEEITFDKTVSMLTPKLCGVNNIYELFKNADLDFVWITSSLASLLGGLTFSAYSSANLYMDAFISSKIKELPNWKCVGLAEMIFTDEKQNQLDPTNKGLRPSEITSLFEWSLSVADCPVILETVEELSSRVYRTYKAKRELFLGTPEVEKLERPRLTNMYVSAETETEKRLLQIIEVFFGIKNIGIEDNFFELGGDSLKAMVLIKRIKMEFHLNISLKEFFNSQTIREIAIAIEEKIWLNKSSEKKFSSII